MLNKEELFTVHDVNHRLNSLKIVHVFLLHQRSAVIAGRGICTRDRHNRGSCPLHQRSAIIAGRGRFTRGPL